MTHAAHLIRTLNAPTPDDFDSNFLEKISFADVERWLTRLMRQHGEALEACPTDDEAIWEVTASQGQYRVLARYDGDGRLSGFRFPQPDQTEPWQIRVALLMPWLLAPVVFLVSLHPWRYATQLDWLRVAVPGLLFIAVVLVKFTSATFSLYLWPIYAAAGLLLLASASRLRDLPFGSVDGGQWLVSVCLSLMLILPLVAVARGHRVPPNPVRLGQVLAGGTFQVGQGGSTPQLNYHVAHPHMRYAVDFIGVNRWGRHAIGLMPAEPQKYAIFGSQVLAPLDGVVEQVRADLPDLPVPQTDELRAAGNHIVIRGRAEDGREIRVLLAHLQRGSVNVTEGQSVRAGQVIARVGNSGNTTEPHLHLGVNVGGEADQPLSGEGVPFLIEGRFPVRNMLFRAAATKVE